MLQGIITLLRNAGKANEIESKVINNSTQEQITNPLEAQNTNAVVTSNSVTHSQSGSGQSVDMGATMSANELLSKPQAQSPTPEPIPNPEVDLAKAALEVQSNSLVQEEFRNPSSTSIANQDISWYNQGVALIEAGKYAEALSCFDRALPSFSDDDEMVIRILNGRGNAFYYLENYPAVLSHITKPCLSNQRKFGAKHSTIWALHMLKWRDIRTLLSVLSRLYQEDCQRMK